MAFAVRRSARAGISVVDAYAEENQDETLDVTLSRPRSARDGDGPLPDGRPWRDGRRASYEAASGDADVRCARANDRRSA